MASTLVGPIRIPQINRNYYVGEPMQRNIQQAVTFAIANSNAGNVIIPQDYTGSDTVAAVTGGSPTVYIIDERHGQRQAYLWYNNAYIYEPTHASGGVLTPQLNNYAYVGFGTNPTIQGVINTFADLPTLTITIIIEPSYTGGEVIANLTNGDPGIVLSDQRTAQWQNYNWNGIQFVPTDFEPLGQIIATSIITDSIEGGEATFAECIVDNSPVRTFANTADAPSGMIWPDIGIAVSQGSAWASPSINPATIAYVNQPNTFSANQTVTGNIAATGDVNAATLTSAGITKGSEFHTGTNGAILTDEELSIGFNGITMGQKLGAPFGQLFEIRTDYSMPRSFIDSWGDLYINSGRPGAGVYVTGILTSTAAVNATNVTATNTVAAATVNATNVTATNTVAAATVNASGAVNAGSVVAGTVTGTLHSAGWASSMADQVVTVANNSITIGQQIGAPFGQLFEIRTDNSMPRSFIDSWGELHINDRSSGTMVVNGTFVVNGTKNFRIDYPNDNTKWISHSTLEGPEIAVYYRGEGITKAGVAEITLPEYFEVMTRPEGRTVYLTQLFEDDDEDFANLATSRVVKGKFRVMSSTPTQKFYWEVKAVRSDQPPLEVVTEKEPIDHPDIVKT